MLKRIGVLISGGGTNLQALIDAEKNGIIKSGKIVCVCSNSAKAYGLTRAENAGIPTRIIRKNADCGGDIDEFSRKICEYMKEMQVDIIVLAGFLAIFGGDLLREYADRNEVVYGGRILLQKAVCVEEGDTPEILQKRVMEQAEWIILPKAVEMLCQCSE